MQKGNIGITTENIFPVIKKFLYSDHDIFLRELVSNAVDATQKLKTLASKGELAGEMGELKVEVKVDKDAGTLTISDRGIGMTAEEIDKYINQIAFSGANDFLEKYKQDANAIIGHFGLGFYSAFMVAKEVEIITRSYREDATPVRWVCDGSPAYEISECEKTDRGTDIVLHIDDESKEFLEKNRISDLLKKYCSFLPVNIVFGKKTEWKDGKQQDTDEDNVINDPNPLWTKQPQDLKEEDYKEFYRKLYPMTDEPLFWIHLNVDYPFHLTGVLYFPKIKSNLDLHRNKIQLYCNQVFVTDQVENIVPEFLTLLHGVIDSPDIPLNVSRSYLQSDANVKKISTYITKKVSDRLASLFKSDRPQYEEKWNDLKLFIHYGMLSQPDFYDKAKAYSLLTDTTGKHFSYDEYRTLIEANQTDKEGNVVYLYATDTEAQYPAIQTAQEKGYNVLLMDGQLDSPLVGMLEQKLEKSRFARVDADTIDRLIVKDDQPAQTLSEDDRTVLTGVFKARVPQGDEKAKMEFHVEAANLGESAAPVCVTQSEYMRRMKEMSQLQPGMSFYGEMPDMYNLVLNADHPVVARILSEANSETQSELSPVAARIKELHARRTVLEEEQRKAEKDSDAAKSAADDLKTCDQDIHEAENQREAILSRFAEGHPAISQLVDLALLQNGLLKGAALTAFVKRSVEMM